MKKDACALGTLEILWNPRYQNWRLSQEEWIEIFLKIHHPSESQHSLKQYFSSKSVIVPHYITLSDLSWFHNIYHFF